MGALAAPHEVSFRRFSNQLYCSGAMERACTLPGSAERRLPGECLWFKPDNRPVTAADMDGSKRSSWANHHWDARAVIGADHMRRFDAASGGACVRGKHVMIFGESTTRDLFFTFSEAVGLKPNRAPCMNVGKKPPCTRVVRSADNRTVVSFQFLSKANASSEVALTRSLWAERKPDIVFTMCMMYDWTGLGLLREGADACMQHLDEAILTHHPGTPVYLLGPTYPPNWYSPYVNRTQPESIMARTFAEINRAAGISCAPSHHGEEVRYRVQSRRGIHGPIDRYNVVGHRKRDMIHPFPSAHAPTVQMMLNHLCPAREGAADDDG